MIGGLLSRLAGSFGFGGGGNQPPQAGPQPQQLGPGMPNYAHQMGYRGGMQNPEAAMMAQRYGGGQAGYGGFNPSLQKGDQMIQDFNGTFPDPRQDPSVMQDMAPPQAKYGGNTTTMGQLRDIAPQDYVKYGGDTTTMGQLRDPIMNTQMNTQIGGAMGNDQGYGDLMGGQGGFSNKMPNQGYDDLMGGQGGFASKMPNQGYDDLMGGQGGFAENPFSKVGGGNAWDAYNQQRSNVGSMTSGGGGGQQLSGAYAAPSWGGKAGYGGKGGASVIERAGSMMNPSLGGKGGFSMTKGAGMASNLGDIAKRFKPMSKGGYSIGEMFKPGGMTNTLLGKGGKVGAAISSAPAWAMPAAGAAAFGVKHIMKRSKQKKHQKQQNAQRDQIKNAAANGQYVTGNLGNLSGPRNY